ncbi:MAG: hypothetical protein H6835_06670 [Planctomycetes bacterium]|nr:hypothetical protein [Planctomycetota bacterium]
MTEPLLCTIPYCGRLNYLRMLLATLREADDIERTRVLIYKTRPGLDVPEKLLRGLDAQVVELDLGAHKNRLAHHSVWQHVFVNHYEHDHLLSFDCDAAVHPWALVKTREMIERFPDLGMGCLFNQESYVDIDFGDPLYFLKRQIGFLGVVMSRKVVAMMWDKPSVDSIYSKACVEAGLKIYCTRTSFVEHLGWEGLNSPDWTLGLPEGDRMPDGQIRIARARRFMSEYQ